VSDEQAKASEPRTAPPSPLLPFTLEGEEMILNMGPHHPSTHGVLRFIVRTDGEVMTEANPDVGYLHRAIEKIAEGVSYEGFMPYTDRIDYLAAMPVNHLWAVTVERLLGHPVPPRAEYLRVITDELSRIASHHIMLGATAMDLGAVTVFPWLLREREMINDLLEELCGARLTFNYHRIGGVAKDLPPGWSDKVLRFVDQHGPILDELDRLISGNEIFVRRNRGVAVITEAEARSYSLVGPNARASGLDFDTRRDLPYSVYPQILEGLAKKGTPFRVALGRDGLGVVGDCWNRFYVRVDECRESLKLVREALEQIPAGDVWTPPKKIKPKGEALGRVEAARGLMSCYVVADGGASPYRAHFRTGSFTSMGTIREKSRGLMVADLVALIATLDVIAPEIDR
jgi:NADH-quinone oxidoreductase subunit D